MGKLGLQHFGDPWLKIPLQVHRIVAVLEIIQPLIDWIVRKRRLVGLRCKLLRVGVGTANDCRHRWRIAYCGEWAFSGERSCAGVCEDVRDAACRRMGSAVLLGGLQQVMLLKLFSTPVFCNR